MNSLKIAFATFLLLNSSLLFAQKATEANRPQDTPLDFSKPENIVLFIVIPIVFVILYFVWRNLQKKDRLKAEEQKRKENLEMGRVERTDNYKNRE